MFPPTLSARVRLLGSTKASKNDRNDALATAIAGMRHCGLRTVRLEDCSAVIRIRIDRYDDLVALRTQAGVPAPRHTAGACGRWCAPAVVGGSGGQALTRGAPRRNRRGGTQTPRRRAPG